MSQPDPPVLPPREVRETGVQTRDGGTDGPISAKVMTSPVEKVGVLGAGVMGAGIAQWCSARGLTVRLKDIKPDFVAAASNGSPTRIARASKRRKMSELDAQHGLARVHPTTDYTGFGDCDLVIEAVLEKIEVKRQAYGELAEALRNDCIIASNTSAIPIDDLAEASGRPKRFVGIHFFNPVHKMPLVEIVSRDEDGARGCRGGGGICEAAEEDSGGREGHARFSGEPAVDAVFERGGRVAWGRRDHRVD